MTNKGALLTIVLFAIAVNVGVWLMGIYGLEIRVGSHVFGRYIGINDKETWSSLLGWALVVGAIIMVIVLAYRHRSKTPTENHSAD